MAGKKPIWYVTFPLSRYRGDVKAMAVNAGLRIVDAAFDAGDGAKITPHLELVNAPPTPATKPKTVKPKADDADS